MRIKLLLKTIFLTALITIAGKVGWTQITSTQTGAWSATTTWAGGVVPTSTDNVVIADGHTVTIDLNVTISNLTVGQGTSGVLTFDNVAMKSLTVTGNVTIAAGGSFIPNQYISTTGTYASGATTITAVASTTGLAVGMSITGSGIPSNTTITAFDATTITISAATTAAGTAATLIIGFNSPLAIGGDFLNNGTFDLSTGLCSVTFNKAGDQTIAGTGTTKFRYITLAKTDVANKVLCSTNVSLTASGAITYTAGTWEQTAGTLTVTTGSQNIATATGALIFSGSGSLDMQVAGSIAVTGKLEVNTTGTFKMGSGNNAVSTAAATAILNFLKGDIYIYGRLQLTLGTTTIDGVNIYIDPQSTSNLGGSSNTFEINGGTVNFSSGSVTLVDPNAALTSGNDLKINSATLNMTGGTIYIGDGISTSVSTSTSKYAGFNLSTAGYTIKNLVFQTSGISGRNSQLKGSLIVSGTLTLSSGTFDIYTQTLTLNNPIAGTATNLLGSSVGSLAIAGTASGISIPSNIISLKNLTINNTAGATTNSNLVVFGTLTLTAGKLDISNYNLAIKTAATSTTSPISGGSSSSYVVTSGIGSMYMKTFGTGSVTYPVGASTSSYTPYISTNNTSADSIGVNVHTPITNATLDNTRIVNLEWLGKEGVAGSNDGTITFSWNATDQATNFDPTKKVYFGVWNGSSYAPEVVTVNGTGPYNVVVNAPTAYPPYPVIFGNGEAFYPSAPALTADASSNDVDHNIDITFTDDAIWRAAITAVKDGSTILTSTTDYTISNGTITLIPTATNSLRVAGSRTITIEANGYADALVSQTINTGVPTVAKSTISNAPAMGLGITSTVTVTAKDQFENLVSGYVFKYDATVKNDNVTTGESYTIAGNTTTTSATDVDLIATNASGVAIFDIVVPNPIDPSDGVSVQVQLNDGTSNLGSPIEYFSPAGPSLAANAALNEVTLNNAKIVISVLNETFADNTLDPARFTLNNAPTGLTVGSVNLETNTSATVALAYDGTDFDSDSTHLSVTIAGSEFTLGKPLTSNDLTITALVETVPVVATNSTITSNGYTTATWGGTISSDGGEPLIQIGLCWNTTGTPTISDSKTEELVKSIYPSITGNMTSLTPGTKYYVRAYATNSVGTNYGDEYNFTTKYILPVFTSGYPKSAYVASTRFNIVVNVDAVGKVYYLKLASGTAAPTSATVKATGTAINVTTISTDFSAQITGLTNSTTYDVYFVTENYDASELMATPVLLSVTTSIPTVTPYEIQYTLDASGDSPYATQPVITTGIVTAIKYNSSAVQQGYYIQTTTGEWNGVYIYTSASLNTAVVIGDNVTVAGTIKEFNKMTEMDPVTGVTINTSGNTLPTAVLLTTLAANDEKYESVLCKVQNAICSSDNGSGTAVVSDGSGNLTVYKNLYSSLMLTVNHNYDITGIIADFYSTSHLYELYPRSVSDISDLSGINDNPFSTLTVYPNPFTNEIRFDGVQNVKRIVITNITGQVVKNDVVISNAINTENITNGMYFVTLINDKDEKVTVKMIKN